MCGLAFYQDSLISDPEVDVFNQLMVATSLRGKDSSGVCAIFKPMFSSPDSVKPLVRIQKKKGSIYSLLESSDYIRAVGAMPSNRQRSILFGHCRQATKGGKTVSNSHPFFTGALIGVHNGTILSGLEIPEGETDSQALFEKIEKEGVDSLKDVVGAYALIWYDLRDNTLNILRNELRPLHFCTRGSSIIGASERSALEFISSRNNLSFSKIEEFKPFHLYRLKVDKEFRIVDKRFEIEDKTGELKKVVGGAACYSNFRKSDSFYGAYEDCYYWERPPFEKGEKKDEETGFVKLTGTNVEVTRNKYNEYLKRGCAVCGSESGEDDWVYWRNADNYEREYICSECALVQSYENDKVILESFPGLLEEFNEYNRNLLNINRGYWS